MTLQKLIDYHASETLLAVMQAILAPSYKALCFFAFQGLVQPVAVVQHELYTLRKRRGELIAFSMRGTITWKEASFMPQKATAFW